MTTLKESLKPNDLEHLVLSVIEIDTFESKIDDEESVVVALFVDDKEPAKDLERFISKSAIDIIDSEVSPAPDKNGNFVVFIEIQRDKEFIEKLLELTDSIKSLTNIEDFEFKTYKKKNTFPLSKDEIKKRVRLKQKPKEAEVLDFLEDSNLDNALIKNETLTLERLGQKISKKILDFGSIHSILHEHGINESAISLDDMRSTNNIERMLGPGWLVVKIDQFTAIQKQDNPTILLLH